MKKRLWIVLLVVTACTVLAFAVKNPVILAQSQDVQVSARQAQENNRITGEIVAGDQVLFRIRTTYGGYSPFERAQMAADRLNKLMSSRSISADDITTGRLNGQEVVLAKKHVIATANAEEARLNNTTTMQLAAYWASRIENVVSGRGIEETPIAKKIVPIISVGSGIRVGGAQVTGPSNRVHDVKAVAQLEGNFDRTVRIRILVPVSTENVVSNISRVPGTSVDAMVDIKL